MRKLIKTQTIKSQKGSASSIALFTVLLFCIILMGTYMLIMTMQKSQLKSDIRIQEIYGAEIENADEIYIEKTAVCYIGNNYYLSLQEAINNAQENTKTSIQITKDFTEANLITIPEEKNVELLLNGKTMTGRIINHGELTISGEGTILQQDNWVIENDGDLKISEATVETKKSSTYAIRQTAGKMTLENANIKNIAETSVINEKQVQALEINGGTWNKTGGTITGTTSEI